MSELPTGRLVFAVAQVPFDSANQETQNVNTFGTLAPVLDENGAPARRDDYPEAGLVWWMLRSGARAFAEPGRLISAHLQWAIRHDPGDPESHLFQVEFEGVEPIRANIGVEVLTVTSTRVQRARDLVSLPGLVELDHPPSDYVMVRWDGNIYGPLRAMFERRNEAAYAVSFTTQSGNPEVMRLPNAALTSLREGYVGHVTAEVSLDSRPRHNASRVLCCHYELLTAVGLDRLRAERPDTIPLLRDDELLRRAAKSLFQRKERQHFGQLLERLSAELMTTDQADAEVADLVQRTQERLRRGDQLADDLADALIKSGLIDESVQARLRERAESYVEENVVTLRGQIAERTRTAQDELERLRTERERLEQEMQRTKRDVQGALHAELDALRRQHEERIRLETSALVAQQRDLDRQRELVIGQLDAVRERYENSRGEVLQDFVALLPLLERVLPTGLGAAGSRAAPAQTVAHPDTGVPAVQAGEEASDASPADISLALPEFVVRDTESSVAISEPELLARFRDHVRAMGFEYRDLDLLSFHLSVKCGDLTILGGVSGTGKSTLPKLYATALAGELEPDNAASEGRYLHVGVRPSWLDQQDLLGHVNSIDGRFVPSDSGLYEFVIWAQREFEQKQSASGVYLACLDEMNLSHVEHYFSGFLQALERPDGLRKVRCFDVRSVRADDPFRSYHQLNLPLSLRFVGTVNYDETTKPLSLRLLDRANVLQLQTTSLRGVDIGGARDAGYRVAGPTVRLQDLRAWTKDEELERPFAEFLDRLRAPLAVLRAPLTPRRDRAIRRFVTSATGVVESPWVAFDLQIVQRILPQIRAVFGPDARQGLQDLVNLIKEYAAELPETQRSLAVLADRELGALDV